MRSRTTLIHQSGSDGSIIRPLLNFLLNLRIGIDIVLFQSIDINPQSFMLAYFKLLLLGFGEKIPHTLIIDFKHTNFNLKRAGSILITFDLLEDGIADDGYQSLIGAISDHGVGFPRAGLTIRKEAAIITIPTLMVKYQALTRMLEPMSS